MCSETVLMDASAPSSYHQREYLKTSTEVAAVSRCSRHLSRVPVRKCEVPGDADCSCCFLKQVWLLTQGWRNVQLLLTLFLFLLVSLLLEGYISEAITFKYVFQM